MCELSPLLSAKLCGDIVSAAWTLPSGSSEAKVGVKPDGTHAQHLSRDAQLQQAYSRPCAYRWQACPAGVRWRGGRPSGSAAAARTGGHAGGLAFRLGSRTPFKNSGILSDSASRCFLNWREM